MSVSQRLCLYVCVGVYRALYGEIIFGNRQSRSHSGNGYGAWTVIMTLWYIGYRTVDGQNDTVVYRIWGSGCQIGTVVYRVWGIGRSE